MKVNSLLINAQIVDANFTMKASEAQWGVIETTKQRGVGRTTGFIGGLEGFPGTLKNRAIINHNWAGRQCAEGDKWNSGWKGRVLSGSKAKNKRWSGSGPKRMKVGKNSSILSVRRFGGKRLLLKAKEKSREQLLVNQGAALMQLLFWGWTNGTSKQLGRRKIPADVIVRKRWRRKIIFHWAKVYTENRT